ncbi:MAG: DUF4430 domain-containing protein [Oscillospiraceae bacterium]|nr:DUF4430 domain-containing protein [Oscillospiraceae bacterium]
MRLIFSAVCALIAAQTALSFSAVSHAELAAEIPPKTEYCTAVEEVFDYLTGERGGFFEGLEFGQSDWAAYCAARLGGEYAEGSEDYAESVRAAVSELSMQSFVPPTELQRAAVVLSGFGECPAELIGAAAYNNTDLDKQGLNAWIWALVAANCAGAEHEGVNTRESLAEHIISAALPDGGFTLRGEKADCDITAAAIYALAPLDTPAAKEALGAALDCLTDMQLESGGFSSMGKENCESSAQAIIAFTAAGYDTNDSRVSRALSAMLEYRREQGFAHTLDGKTNGVATVQALQALTALRLRERGERLFEPSKEDTGAPLADTHEKSPTAETEESAGILPPENTELSGFAVTVIISAALGAVGLAGIIVGALRRGKAVVAVSAVILAAAGGVWLLDIRSPSEYYSESVAGDMRVTVGADCLAALAVMDRIDEGVNPVSVIPEDGVVIAECTVSAEEGASAFDALVAAAREQRVAVDYVGSFYGVYVRGIGHIYEFGFGDMSGWLYTVNGESPDVSSGEYILSEGDRVEFTYTVG